MKVKCSTATNPLVYSAQNESMIEKIYNEVGYKYFRTHTRGFLP